MIAPIPMVENNLANRQTRHRGPEHQDPYHFHDHRFHVTEETGDTAALLSRMGNGIAEQQRKHDDLQHLAIGHGPHRVGGEDIHQHIRKRRRT